jgi:hypothetical protein
VTLLRRSCDVPLLGRKTLASVLVTPCADEVSVREGGDAPVTSFKDEGGFYPLFVAWLLPKQKKGHPLVVGNCGCDELHRKPTRPHDQMRTTALVRCMASHD